MATLYKGLGEDPVDGRKTVPYRTLAAPIHGSRDALSAMGLASLFLI
jgi:hypothetical protein